MRSGPLPDVWRQVAAFPVRPAACAYAVVSVLLLPFPLVGLLHVESAAVMAGAAFFVAALTSVRPLREGAAPIRLLARQEATLVVPWAVLTLSLLWRPNCGYGHGLLFFALFPVVTVPFAVGLAHALTAARVRRPRLLAIGVGIGVMAAGPVFDLGFHPQFYTYNHVFGGVLGPLYDEELAVRPDLFAFRLLTLLWAAFLFSLGAAWRKGGRRWAIAGTALVLVGMGYALRFDLGFNTSHEQIQAALGGVYRTRHFDLYFDPTSTDRDGIRRIAEAHEWHYSRLKAKLEVAPRQRVRSYLYPDADRRAALTGARWTGVAPVWLAQPQMHMLLSEAEAVMPHELVHVFSREFGLPLLRASLSVGLVEGLAVALEPPDGAPSPDEQVLAAAAHPALGRRPAADVAAMLSPAGFWTQRGPVAYATMGSFVAYLLERYPSHLFRKAYAGSDFGTSYGKPVPVLAAEWEAWLQARPSVSRAARALAARRFSVPSLFEERCPHWVPRYERALRQALRKLDEGREPESLELLERSLRLNPVYAPALAVWADLKLAEGSATEVTARIDSVARRTGTPLLFRQLGDASGLLGDTARARAHYTESERLLPRYAYDARCRLILRRMLTSRQDVLRVLVSRREAGASARELLALAPSLPAVRLLAAQRWAAAGAPERALALAGETSLTLDGLNNNERRQLEAQHYVWMAHYAYRAGLPDAALAHARRAEKAFLAFGDRNQAARIAGQAAQWQAVRRSAAPASSRAPEAGRTL